MNSFGFFFAAFFTIKLNWNCSSPFKTPVLDWLFLLPQLIWHLLQFLSFTIFILLSPNCFLLLQWLSLPTLPGEQRGHLRAPIHPLRAGIIALMHPSFASALQLFTLKKKEVIGGVLVQPALLPPVTIHRLSSKFNFTKSYMCKVPHGAGEQMH